MLGISEHVLPLRRETLEDGVYRRLCELILKGGIVPGESITVASLAEAFEVSPMPVRNALTRLTSAGALTVISGRTIGIPKLTRERLAEVMRVRLTVEPAAAAWAAEKVTTVDLKPLSTKFQALVDNEKGGYSKIYLQANYDFHFEIYRLAGSSIMMNIIETLWLQIAPYFHLLTTYNDFQISQRHHEGIFRGIETNQPDRAHEAMHGDIADAFEVLKGYF
ncbi:MULTISPECIES: GntR family transcriptional regulator [Rhizobium]|uniref:GntR family transcriptional regulator n=1 Tax=Rhizobium TaxID=379 RepID=UPI00055D301E|nr:MULTISPECIES: GntR family transcriptional regulator [Rhizobium]MCB2402362.1 GntR family transcriptional regulator [Rhizobium ruizarguesonis]TAX26771.1 GntR family transcriptional regulator [Rhizobium leguminosarum]